MRGESLSLTGRPPHVPRRAQNPPNPRCAHAGLHRAAAAATAASSAGVQFPKTQAFCTSYSAPWPRPAAGPPSAGHAAPFRSVLASAIPGFLGSAAWNAWAPRNIASSRDGRRLTGTGRRATGALESRTRVAQRAAHASSKQAASFATRQDPGRDPARANAISWRSSHLTPALCGRAPANP